MESYYLSVYEGGLTSFTDALAGLFHDEPHCERFLALMRIVADGVAALHAAGVRHGDLGNQNILLRRDGTACSGDVRIVDLNRARVRDPLSARDRAVDVARIYLPSDLLRIFREMYYGDATPPSDFLRWERLYRRLYRWHNATRMLRHPVRERRARRRDRRRLLYPHPRDLWVWDERSAQAIATMRPRERTGLYPHSRPLGLLVAGVSALLPVWREYRRLLPTCFAQTIHLQGRIGVAVSPTPETLERRLALLEALGPVPVLVRFYHHEQETQWRFLAATVKALRRRGHAVTAALVQDRRAVTDPARWRAFAEFVLQEAGPDLEALEVGHAINRVKWGVWSFGEYRELVEGVAAAASRFPGTPLMGPAVIDFEYPFVMAALRSLPDGVRFGALSHHLYVDRRGAPENRQGPFSALDKFALLRAMARKAGPCADRVVVSEVNWPLAGTGVYSPVGSPYVSPGVRFNDPSVSEEEYADYMVRYLALALCSGMVDQVFWWRLVARGFGLVDDRDPEHWRRRPACDALERFLSLVGDSTFVERIMTSPAMRADDSDGPFLLRFERRDGRHLCLGWVPHGQRTVALPFACESAVDALGVDLPCPGRSVQLSGRPVYLFMPAAGGSTVDAQTRTAAE